MPSFCIFNFIVLMIFQLGAVLHFERSHCKGYLHWRSLLKRLQNILASFDGISLYTNILHAHGLEALSYWINKHPGNLYERFSKQFVLESGRLILENNNCKFNDEFFVQMRWFWDGNDICSYICNVKYGSFWTNIL